MGKITLLTQSIFRLSGRASIVFAQRHWMKRYRLHSKRKTLKRLNMSSASRNCKPSRTPSYLDPTQANRKTPTSKLSIGTSPSTLCQPTRIMPRWSCHITQFHKTSAFSSTTSGHHYSSPLFQQQLTTTLTVQQRTHIQPATNSHASPGKHNLNPSRPNVHPSSPT